MKYILITPARNEEDLIEGTIKSVISQTVLPVKWIIVSDGSTDRTDNIVKQYTSKHDWIELVRMPEHRERHFAAKVQCFNTAHQKVKNIEHDIVGNLDADITFEPDYFEFLLAKFNGDPKLGCAGTPFVESGKHYDYRYTNIEHVSGACQLFRRKCFEDIGGYIPVKGGGIDWIAVTTARMKGWRTRTFTEKTCEHHRKMGTGNTSAIMTSYKQGRKDYFLGNHPLWELFRAAYQMTRKPIMLGGTLILTGYFWSFLTRLERPISNELMNFIRKEQITRLKSKFRCS
jgi:glycosyltransferase involved in cell wall biosynthesis